ncbi:MAG: ABC transporter ATP-binding protein [Candidatus Thiodiazotropha sp.]
MIRVDDLIRTYGDLTAVDGVSFEINQGEIVGLLGHNGAGKTTIMKMLTGYLEPTAGPIEIDGLNIASNRRAVQQRIGYLPENDPLYPEMTVIDYLDYAVELHGVAPDQSLDSIWSAIERTGLTDRAADRIATIEQIEMAGKLSLQRQQGDMQLAGLETQESTNLEEVNNLVSKLDDLRIQSLLGEKESAVCQHREPGFSVEVKLKDGKLLSYQFYEVEDESGYIFKCSDRDRYFEVAAYLVDPLKEASREKLVVSNEQ